MLRGRREGSMGDLRILEKSSDRERLEVSLENLNLGIVNLSCQGTNPHD